MIKSILNEVTVSLLIAILGTNFHSIDLQSNSILNCSISNTGQENHEVNSSLENKFSMNYFIFQTCNRSHRSCAS
jgi:hypothetical protein